MKKILIILAFAGITAIQAQTPRTSYFMDKFANRHLRNPALTPAWGYVNFPVLGRLDFALESNISLSDFIYPVSTSEKPGTFMHPEVSAKEFLGNIEKGNNFGIGFGTSVLGFGFYVNNDRFFSFDVGVKADLGFNLPKDMFGLFKELSSSKSYDMKNLNITARGYVDLALGYAQDWDEYLRVGGKVKFLIGVADARFMVDKFNLAMTQEAWKIDVSATGAVNGGFLQVGDSAGIVDLNDITLGMDEISPSTLINGFGAGFDLGAVYNLDRFMPAGGLSVSFALTDLGFINYSKDKVTSITSEGSYNFTGIEGISLKDSFDLSKNIEEITEDVSNMMKPRKSDGEKGITRGLRTTMNVGAEYSFLDNKMSAGLLLSTHFGKPKTFTELTLSYNLRPWNWFAVSFSSSIMHGFFRSAGFAMNITPKYGLNLFLGLDYFPFAYGWLADGIPFPVYTTNFNFNFGLSVPIGGNRYHKYPSRKRQSIDERTLMTE